MVPRAGSGATRSDAGPYCQAGDGSWEGHSRSDEDRREAFAHVTAIALEVALHEGTRRFRRAGVVATFEGGKQLRLGVEAQGASIAMQGLGYSGGYDDGRGLGAWRGENHLESDVWDVSHPSKVVYPDGTSKEHWHRIQPVSIAADLDGETSVGTASMTLTIAGRLPAHLQLKSAGPA